MTPYKLAIPPVTRPQITLTAMLLKRSGSCRAVKHDKVAPGNVTITRGGGVPGDGGATIH